MRKDADLKSPVNSDRFDLIGNQIVVIQSDGAISVDDSLIPASKWRNELPKSNVGSTSLKEYLAQPFFTEINNAQRNIPDDCQKCCWKKLCRGGDLENRFSSDRGFNNKSIYCSALMIFYEHVVKYLVSNGYPVDKIEEKLLLANMEPLVGDEVLV